MTAPPSRQVHQGGEYPAVEREATEEAPAERDEDMSGEDRVQGVTPRNGDAPPRRARQGVAFGMGRGGDSTPDGGVAEVPRVLALA